MSENFPSAAVRHHSDAALLLDEGRFDNAGYLAGYTVECTLKAIILCFHEVHPRKYGHDLNALGRKALELCVILSPALQRYPIETAEEILASFSDWVPSQRYSETGKITKEKAIELVSAAKKAWERLLIPMILDGYGDTPK